MGQARSRGSREDRIQQSIERQAQQVADQEEKEQLRLKRIHEEQEATSDLESEVRKGDVVVVKDGKYRLLPSHRTRSAELLLAAAAMMLVGKPKPRSHRVR